MKVYSLSELLNSTYNDYKNIKFQLDSLRESVVAKEKFYNLSFTAAFVPEQNKEQNLVYVWWDNDNPYLKNFLIFCKKHGIIPYQTNIDVVKYDYENRAFKQFHIIDIDKWNYYYKCLTDNNFIRNIVSQYDDDNVMFNMTADTMSANMRKFSIGSIGYVIDQEDHGVLSFNTRSPYQISYEKVDLDIQDFMHEFKIPADGLNDYLCQKLDQNNGKEFDLENRIIAAKVENKSKILSYKIK